MAIDSVLDAADRADGSFNEIPIIDMKNASSTDTSVRKQLAREIRDACINVGFFYVKNHDIPEDKILGAVNAGKDFFALSDETKMKYDSSKSPNFKGYSALLMENNDPDNRGDLHESFDIGPEDNDRSSKSAMSGGNMWPTELPHFRQGYLGYYDEAVAFGRKLFPLFALALDLPEDFFSDKTREAAAIMRVLHYPPQFGPRDDRVLGIGAHTDFECFTILWQEPNIQALQVMNSKKEWIHATPIPGTLVINIGDQLERWTNGAFKSTVHRAINRTGIERHSMPVFFGVDYNVELKALPNCVPEGQQPRFEAITAGEYVKARLAAAYSKK